MSNEEMQVAVRSRESVSSACRAAAALGHTSAVERIVPGKVDEPLFREHEARYIFASKFVRGQQVLDVACGTGIGTHYLLTMGARDCVGIDIDVAAVGYASTTYKGCGFVQCDATNLCFPDTSVDVVVSFETIEHLRDQLRFLRECQRVLRPGGVLVCSTPNHTIYRWERNPYHLHEFTVSEFTTLLSTLFDDVRLYAQNTRVWLLYVIRRLLSRTLDQLRLKSTAKRILGWKPTPLADRTEFSVDEHGPNNEIHPYRATRWVEPTYLIAVCRKPLG